MLSIAVAGGAFSETLEGAFLREPRGIPLSERVLRVLVAFGTTNPSPADGVPELMKLTAKGATWTWSAWGGMTSPSGLGRFSETEMDTGMRGAGMPVEMVPTTS